MRSGTMTHKVTAIALAAACLGFTAALSGVGAAQEAKTAMSGIYSEEQAAQGERYYRRICAKCHLSDLSGSDPSGAVPGETPPPLPLPLGGVALEEPLPLGAVRP